MTGLEFVLQLGDYEAVRSRLMIRPLNYPDYSYELDDYVYRRIGDIALVLYALINDRKDSMTTFRVPRGMLDKWGLTEDAVIDQALMMTSLKAPARIYFSTEELRHHSKSTGAFMSSLSAAPGIDKWDVPILTTTRRLNGAIALFYPGVMERLAYMYGRRNFNVVFTSIHEVRLHSENSIPREYMENSLAEVNRCSEQYDLLSRKVYMYDILERKLRLAPNRFGITGGITCPDRSADSAINLSRMAG